MKVSRPRTVRSAAKAAAPHTEGQCWCSGHQAWHDEDEFAADGHGKQRYCRAYRARYMRERRRREREAAGPLVQDRLERLAQKHRERATDG